MSWATAVVETVPSTPTPTVLLWLGGLVTAFSGLMGGVAVWFSHKQYKQSAKAADHKAVKEELERTKRELRDTEDEVERLRDELREVKEREREALWDKRELHSRAQRLEAEMLDKVATIRRQRAHIDELERRIRELESP